MAELEISIFRSSYEAFWSNPTAQFCFFFVSEVSREISKQTDIPVSQINFGLSLKARPDVHPFMWKLGFIHMQMTTNFSYEKMSSTTHFEEEANHNSEMAHLTI